ncbi:MAG: exo-beta-N-acetylmuramidase NamZ domain-containing protein [Marinilabiliaceae bacterium]
MRTKYSLFLVVLGMFLFVSCQAGNSNSQNLQTGAGQTEEWLPLLKDQRVGLLVNHTSMVGETHLVDKVLDEGVDVVRIFAPEHGFRGDADAGEHVEDMVDEKTGVPVVSIYGDNRKPSPEQMEGLDVVIFDVQDVGVRFYTYISSMHYMMEACAENDVDFIVLDRPNPNGEYFDGPVLEPEFKSFVGMHPIPVVHGLTVGELARMINGEGWLEDGVNCDLEVVEMTGYTHSTEYSLPVKPSPNLPNDLSVRIYPSLCFFEATIMSVGRGTDFPFQVVGAPDSVYGDFTFTPRSIEGMDSDPKYKGQECYGKDYRDLDPWEQKFSLEPFSRFYERSEEDSAFVSRRRWFHLLSGTDQLLKQIEEGLSESEIRKSWEDELNDYARLRQKYLLYPE